MSLRRTLRSMYRSAIMGVLCKCSSHQPGDILTIKLAVNLAPIEADGFYREEFGVLVVPVTLICKDVSQLRTILLGHTKEFVTRCCISRFRHIEYRLRVKFPYSIPVLHDEIHGLFGELGDRLFEDGIEIPDSDSPQVRVLLLQRAILQKALECMS